MSVSLVNRLSSPFRRMRARVSERTPCRLSATMTLALRDVDITGLILDISPFGCRFRPELAYLVVRNGEAISIAVAGRRMVGTIVATSPAGYGIRFDDEYDIGGLV